MMESYAEKFGKIQRNLKKNQKKNHKSVSENTPFINFSRILACSKIISYYISFLITNQP